MQIIELLMYNVPLLTNEKFEELEIVKENKSYFLYGSVSPDITLGKKYIKEIDNHCHKWETALNILNNSKFNYCCLLIV